MPVDRASYRGWEGTVRPSRMVIFAIAGTMIRRALKQRIVRFMIWSVTMTVCLMAAGFFYAASAGIFDPLKEWERMFPGLNTLAVMNRGTLKFLTPVAMLMAAVVGTPLIAEDQRAKALPLYFSRPISHLDYVLGKFLTIIWYTGLILILPSIVMYLLEIGFTAEAGSALEQFPVFLKSLIPGAVGCMIYASLALGVSSLTEKTNQAALTYFGVLMLASAMAAIFSFELFREPSWLAVSPGNCIERIAGQLFALPHGMEVIMASSTPKLVEMSATTAWVGAAAWIALGLGILLIRVRKVEVVS